MAPGSDYTIFLWRLLCTEESQNCIVVHIDALHTEGLLLQPFSSRHYPEIPCVSSHFTSHLCLHCPLYVGLSPRPASTFSGMCLKTLLRYHFLAKVHLHQLPERMNCFFISISVAVCRISFYCSYISLSVFPCVQMLHWPEASLWAKVIHHSTLVLVPAMQVSDLWNTVFPRK